MYPVKILEIKSLRLFAVLAFSVLFMAFLSGCKKEEFNVPDDFLVYVHGFENEAKLRGKTVDIEKQGLKVEFADFSGKDYVGLTNYENPIRIQIDKHYWNSAPDPYREFVLFHELGHAFLGINEHRNDTLPNGDWTSIMRGPPANGDEHRIDYKNHRDYYLDELFLDHVKHPAWSFRAAIVELISRDTAFGLLPVTQWASKTVTIKNKGNELVFINSLKGSDCFSSNFTGSIQPNDSVNVSLTFSPTEQKQYSGVIEVYHSLLNDTEIKPLTFELSGEGSTSFATGEWIEKTPFPGAARYQAASFSINGSGFVCLGTTYSNNITNEIWEYNTVNQWVKKNNFPGDPRRNPIGLNINGKGYLGLGVERNDFWEYNYSTDIWTKKSEFPGPARVMSVYLSTSTKGYVGLGYDGYTLFNDFWEYDPVSDQWTQLPDYPGKANIYAAAFTVNDRIFVGTGCDGGIVAGHANSDFWEYNSSTQKWVKKSDFAGGKTNSAISFSIDNYGYLGGGSKEDGTGTDNSFWEYDPVNDKWSKKAYMPNFSNGGVYFSAGNEGYFGIGFMTSPYFWEFNPD
jgi:N-acetylneuraminic acid mutarotase